MRKFLLSLRVFLLFFAFGHPIATEAREKKSAAARHSRVERRKKTAKSPRQTAVAHHKKVTRAEKTAAPSPAKAKDKRKQPTPSRRPSPHRAEKAPAAVPNTAGIRKLQSEKADLQRQMNETSRKLSSTRQSVSSGLATLQVITSQITD